MLTFADIFEAHADAFGSLSAVVQGDRELTWSEYEDAAARLASAYAAADLGHGSKVGMFMYNCPEYLVTQFAAFKSRVTPVNVNYRYLDDELLYLLDNADCEAIVFHSSLGDRLARIQDRLPKLKVFIEVPDGPSSEVRGARSWEDVIAEFPPAPRGERAMDDVYMLYTGGTTGMPKGVMYETGTFTRGFLDFYSAPMGRPSFESISEVTDAARVVHSMMGQPVSMPCCPLMHGTGVWLGALVPHLMAGKVVLLEGRSFDAHEAFEVVEKHRVSGLVIVGDAFARPMMLALRERATAGRPFETSSVTTIISTGAMFSTDVKAGIFEHMPSAIVMDILGASEGAMAQMVATKDAVSQTAKFGTMPNTKVFDLETEEEITPGSGHIGMVAVSGANVPLGYYKDPEKSSRTFREIGGVRYSFPGDMAMVEADGSITLLGRGSNCINTAGEKVFPEEVEEAVKTHPDVADCLVFGVPDDRFGQRVVGVASVLPGGQSSPEDVIAHTKSKLSSYKVPKQLVFVAEVPRAPNGKADYSSAKTLFDSVPRSVERT